MKRTAVLLSFLFLAATSALLAQPPGRTNNQNAPVAGSAKKAKKAEVRLKPFSRIAFGGGISLMGVNMQTATNVNRHLNLCGTGNFFDYTVNNINVSSSNGTNGLNLNGKVNFSAAGASMDYYPFATHGLRLSPGVMFYNRNHISASAIASPGTSFTLNGATYYSDSVDPLAVSANLGLNARQKAFTMTTGWGNMIPRKGGHWSFPFELGAAFTGAPTLTATLTGNACSAQADATTNGASCVNMATNTTAQANLAAQIAKYTSDLSPVKVYPILSFGVSYAFHFK